MLCLMRVINTELEVLGYQTTGVQTPLKLYLLSTSKQTPLQKFQLLQSKVDCDIKAFHHIITNTNHITVFLSTSNI